jgi:hypothetical protein
LRDGRLEIINQARNSNKKLYLDYASKQSQISNSWKKWIGVQYGFEKFDVIEKRKLYEDWLLQNAGKNKTVLIEVFDNLNESFENYKYYAKTTDYLNESVFVIEPFGLCNKIIPVFENFDGSNTSDEIISTKLNSFKKTYFSTYNRETDLKLSLFLLSNFIADNEDLYIPASLKNNRTNLPSYLAHIYATSIFTDSVRYTNAVHEVAKGRIKTFINDPLYKLYDVFRKIYNNKLLTNYTYYKTQYQSLYRDYYGLIRQIDTTKVFYPDANLTLRLSYGKVDGYSPSDAVTYYYQTFSNGLIQKQSTGNDDYKTPQRLTELFEKHEFGDYADSLGRLPLCFIASNHTSGGNSGSPVLDAEGRLIGLNFDRTWESTMSDFYFDEKICRNISVDMRYVLFIIDKYAGAGFLMNEMLIER